MLELLKRIQNNDEESRQRSQETIVELAEWSARTHHLRREKGEKHELDPSVEDLSADVSLLPADPGRWLRPRTG